jgi:hypothetical protein
MKERIHGLEITAQPDKEIKIEIAIWNLGRDV